MEVSRGSRALSRISSLKNSLVKTQSWLDSNQGEDLQKLLIYSRNSRDLLNAAINDSKNVILDTRLDQKSLAEAIMFTKKATGLVEKAELQEEGDEEGTAATSLVIGLYEEATKYTNMAVKILEELEKHQHAHEQVFEMVEDRLADARIFPDVFHSDEQK